MESTIDGFRATTGTPFQLSAEAPTREAALQALQSLVHERISAGAEIVDMPVDTTEHPLKEFAGWLPDDALTEEWKQAIEDYRQQVEKTDVP